MDAALDASLLRLTDIRREPLPIQAGEFCTGAVCLPYPGEPFGVAYPLEVPNYGCLYLWSNGRGYGSQTREIVLERELARSRYQRSLSFIRQYQRKGVPLESIQAQMLLPDDSGREPLLQSLQKSLQAGEQAALAVARTRLQRMGGRELFVWGTAINEPDLSIMQALHPPFNQLSLRMTQPALERWEPLVQQAQQERRLVRGESVLDAAFIRQAAQLPQPLHDTLLQRLCDAIRLYRGRIRYWEVLSDLPFSLNPIGSNEREQVRLIGVLCEAARAVDFGIVRLLGAHYSLHHRHTAFQLLHACVEWGVPFEGVHLHLYEHDFDLLDLDSLLEHYGDLGKPLHLTLNLPAAANPFWRASSGEQPLLEWLQQVSTLAMSKPFVVGVQVSANALPPATLRALHAWQATMQPPT